MLKPVLKTFPHARISYIFGRHDGHLHWWVYQEYAYMKSRQQRWSETLKDRFCVYVNVIHNIQKEHDEHFIFSAVVTCSNIQTFASKK